MLSIGLQERPTLTATGAIACLLCLLAGCAPAKYRMAADKEVKYLVEQKSNDSRWDLRNYTIGMDPRSRYFDPTDPDCSPMPYDDPAAHLYMHCVDGKKGWPCWHANGEWYGLENPQWKQLLSQYNEVTKEGAIKLTMNGSVCLAQVHSDGWRDQIEQIYLSALDVSTERFRFDVQFFGDSSTVFTHAGQAQSALGEQNKLTVGQPSPAGNPFSFQTGIPNSLQANRTFSTGGQLVVGFANSFVWQFAGHDTVTPLSLLNFNFVQPLLRSGGRAVVLEKLTRTERNLLYDLRAFERYRQGFYCATTVGNSFVGAVQPVPRLGGLLGGTGLTGFTGQGANGQGGIGVILNGAATGGGGGGAGAGGTGFAGGGAGTVGGFLGVLQSLQNVRIAQFQVDALIRTLGLLEANLDAGLIDIVQVDNFRQNIETARAQLLQFQVTYQTTLDNFKMSNLSLPPDLPIDIDDTMLGRFEFLDRRTTAVQHLIDDFVRVVGGMPAEPGQQELSAAMDVLASLRQRLADRVTATHGDLERLQAVVPVRKETMNAAQQTQFDEDLKKLTASLADIETRFSDTEGKLQSVRNDMGTLPAGKLADEIVAFATGLSGLTQELSLVTARARVETITLPQVKMASERALEIARANRLDWMNQRAALVDAWRLIAFNANALKAGVNLTFSGDLGNIGSNPLAFNGQKGDLRVGLSFDAPFTRRLERNDYRSALISYQSQRRTTYQFEDQVNFILRNLLRTLNQLETNLEIQRRAVVIAIRRVDKTREDLNKPPAQARAIRPGDVAEPPEALGPTVAQNLIFALNDLTSAQNNFVSVVLNHFENRMLLYRELGVMELDDCGMWIDKPLNESDLLSESQGPIPPSVPLEWMQDAGLDPKDVHVGSDQRAMTATATGLVAGPARRSAAQSGKEGRHPSDSAPHILPKRLKPSGQDEGGHHSVADSAEFTDEGELPAAPSVEPKQWADRESSPASGPILRR